MIFGLQNDILYNFVFINPHVCITLTHKPKKRSVKWIRIESASS